MSRVGLRCSPTAAYQWFWSSLLTLPRPALSACTAESGVSNSLSSARKPPASSTLRTLSPAPASTALPSASRNRRKVFSTTLSPSLEIWVRSLQSNTIKRAPSSIAASSSSSSSAATDLLTSPWGLTTKRSPCNSDCMVISCVGKRSPPDCSWSMRKVHSECL